MSISDIIRYLKLKRFTLRSSQFVNERQTLPPAECKKSQAEISKDQQRYFMRYGRFNQYYYLYGFDNLSHAEQDEYIDYLEFMNFRDQANLKSCRFETFNQPFNYISLLRDKFYFALICNSLGISTPPH